MARLFSIVYKEDLTPDIKRIDLKALDIAKKSLPGQFVIIRIDAKGERIPLTIADKDIKRGTITLVFQEVGLTTKKLGRLSVREKVLDVVGPLGKPTEIEKYGNVICIGGGVGIAEVYPVSRALKEVGNRITGIIGARHKELLILESEIRSICDELHITTDDGSYGQKGFVSDILEKLLTYNLQPTTYNLIYAIGPVPMMRKVCEISRPYKIKTIVNLNPVMVDGTGMCGSCRVSVGGEIRFACVHGPEFDGHLVDFDELEARQGLFKEAEQKAISLCVK